jgi:hypothetical protein
MTLSVITKFDCKDQNENERKKPKTHPFARHPGAFESEHEHLLQAQSLRIHLVSRRRLVLGITILIQPRIELRRKGGPRNTSTKTIRIRKISAISTNGTKPLRSPPFTFLSPLADPLRRVHPHAPSIGGTFHIYYLAASANRQAPPSPRRRIHFPPSRGFHISLCRRKQRDRSLRDTPSSINESCVAPLHTTVAPRSTTPLNKNSLLAQPPQTLPRITSTMPSLPYQHCLDRSPCS